MGVIQLQDSERSKISEENIVKRILSGEKELYELLVRRNNQKLYRVVRSYINNEAEIEDVIQNAYVKAYMKLEQFKLDASFSTWLTRIAINEALAVLKANKRLWFIGNNGSDENHVIMMQVPKDNEDNQQDKMIKEERKILLERAVDQLDIKYRSVYVLKEVEELSVKEVAEVLDLSESNVKVRLHRAKEMLKNELLKLSEGEKIFEFGFSRCDRITENVMFKIS